MEDGELFGGEVRHENTKRQEDQTEEMSGTGE